MDEQKNNSAKFAFFYILSLVALVFMAFSVGMIIFQIINKEIVDIINQYSGTYSDEAMKFAISAIIIATPIYYLTSRQIYKNLYKGDLNEEAGVRKWLTYLILLIAAIVMIVNVMGTINGLLGGELTTKSILKTLTVLTIAGTVFAFYFYDVKRENIQGYKDKVISIFAYMSLLIIVAIFVSSWFFVELPAEARKTKTDSQIMRQFSEIDLAINEYYRKNNNLPIDLDELQTDTNYLRLDDFTNPATKEPYDYKVLADNEYQLCTVFQTSNQEVDKYRGYHDKAQRHDMGYQCLDKKIDSNIKPLEPVIIR